MSPTCTTGSSAEVSGAAGSSPPPVAQVDDPVAEAPLVEQAQFQPDASGQSRLATADDDREQEQVDLVHQPGGERVLGQARPTDAEVAVGGVLLESAGP